MSLKLLFVCTGNTCRSPMAEGLARGLFGQDAIVSSAGIDAWEGQTASPYAIEAIKERGLDLSSHRARRVSSALLEEADLILPMTKAQEERLCSLFPEFKDKIKSLGDWAGQGSDIKDPWGGLLNTYRSTAEEIAELLKSLALKLKEK